MAQINESDTLNVKASLSLTGLYQGGNVETIIFRAKSDFSAKLWKNWVYKNQNSYVYQAFNKEKADEDILSLNFLYLNPNRKIYPFVLGFASTNYRREINLRYLIGTGVTFQVLNKNKNWLKLSISGEYENTDYDQAIFNYDTFNGNESINTFRGTIWMNGKYHVFKDKIIVNHEIYVQPSLEQEKNYRWQGDIGVEFPIWKYLNFKINYRHTFESLVILNQEQDDRFLTFGFTLKSFE
ncbi:DUF481 domain-containing protein [Psychroflexus salis]|uniref:DUF481 domain-containing protein n=1 Tax=Psychroflexus salis TaxID=1526574 RepID=A0A916ZNK5_9FLAO|nr:DUF481 domain-containing protein [Psychroflexus salis]GGE06402.1 hypothetical protein GCM10010831_04920 [Psychroflexus salis]